MEYDQGRQRELAAKKVLEGAGKVVSTDRASGMTTAAMTYASLRILAPQFKNPTFASEQEVRLVVQDSRASNFMDKAIYENDIVQYLPSEVDFCQQNGRFVPFVTVKVPLDAVKEIWLGPRSGDSLDEASIRLFLSKHGVNVKGTINRSASSYR